ncbi:hypothetical protein GYMLUDRAFT_156913 [Collybiopsis luxurians FD-317 M1]|nr:hypothetical protein GYMLUDRAFT_156913 [Collybiopsis luxurians FD-317 M1]
MTSIIAEHAYEGASPLSLFINKQLPPLSAMERPYIPHKKTPVEIFSGDTSVVTRKLMDNAGEDAKGRTAVLNLASDRYPGEGWETGISATQEQALCHFSTLFRTLTQPDILSHYPWPDMGPGSMAGIFSEGVVIFREPLDISSGRGFYYYKPATLLPPASRKVISVISVTSPRNPGCTPDGNDFADVTTKEELKEKVRLVLRIAGINGKRYLVLGALGCGGRRCPPTSVAKVIKSVLLEKEFEGWFARIVFAIVDRGYDNFEIFRNVLAGVEV